jgi:hypothetical protein
MLAKNNVRSFMPRLVAEATSQIDNGDGEGTPSSRDDNSKFTSLYIHMHKKTANNFPHSNPFSRRV